MVCCVVSLLFPFVVFYLFMVFSFPHRYPSCFRVTSSFRLRLESENKLSVSDQSKPLLPTLRDRRRLVQNDLMPIVKVEVVTDRHDKETVGRYAGLKLRCIPVLKDEIGPY